MRGMGSQFKARSVKRSLKIFTIKSKLKEHRCTYPVYTILDVCALYILFYEQMKNPGAM